MPDNSRLFCLCTLLVFSGHACPASGLVTPIACEPGYFCISQSSSVTPSAIVTLQKALQAAAGTTGSLTTGGAVCPAGSYCPNATRFAQPCPPGMYCGRSGLKQPQGLCTAGHFCVNTATSNSPQSSSKLCPSKTIGGFCPAGMQKAIFVFSSQPEALRVKYRNYHFR